MSETATDTAAIDTDATATDATKATDKPAELGEAGKKAIDAMKAERDAARREARAGAEAVKKLAELEDSKKSEIDRAMDRVSKAEAELSKVPSLVAQSLKSHLVALHEINDEDAELFLTANDPEVLIKQIGRLTQRQADAEATRQAAAEATEAERKRRGNHVPREGTSTIAPENEERETARRIFGD